MIERMLEPGEVRKRLRHTMDLAKREGAARRAAASAVAKDYERFLDEQATPVLRQLASALRAEGVLFQIFSPAGSVRLASERSKDDYLEVALDTARYPPVVVGRSNHVKGSQVTASEQQIREGLAVAELTDEDVLDWALRALGPFVER
jgi:hypothetical protein